MTSRPHPRGFALIIVLWSVVALGLGATILTSNARRSLAEAAAVGKAAAAGAALDSAVQETVFHLLATGRMHWLASGTRSLRVGSSVVTVALVDLAGTINPNTASPTLLASLFGASGRSPAEAAALAIAILEWRTENLPDRQRAEMIARYRDAGLSYAPPSARFQSIGELGLVLGMTPALLDRLRPDLSLWHDGDPDPAFASPRIRAVLRNAATADVIGSPALPPSEIQSNLQSGIPSDGAFGVPSGPTAIAITCRIESGPARAARRVVVQLLPTAPRPFHIVESTDLPNE